MGYASVAALNRIIQLRMDKYLEQPFYASLEVRIKPFAAQSN